SDEGDAVARTVVNRLADEISVMAITAMCRLDLTALATPVVLGGGVVTARNPLLMSGITRQLAAAAPAAEVRVIDVPPVAGAALLGLDHVHAPAGAAARLRAAHRIAGRALYPGTDLAAGVFSLLLPSGGRYDVAIGVGTEHRPGQLREQL